MLACTVSYAQITDTTKEAPWEKIYRSSATKINDLVHTKLDLKFDYKKAWMYGKAWITSFLSNRFFESRFQGNDH